MLDLKQTWIPASNCPLGKSYNIAIPRSLWIRGDYSNNPSALTGLWRGVTEGMQIGARHSPSTHKVYRKCPQHQVWFLQKQRSRAGSLKLSGATGRLASKRTEAGRKEKSSSTYIQWNVILKFPVLNAWNFLKMRHESASNVNMWSEKGLLQLEMGYWQASPLTTYGFNLLYILTHSF